MQRLTRLNKFQLVQISQFCTYDEHEIEHMEERGAGTPVRQMSEEGICECQDQTLAERRELEPKLT